MKKMLILVLFPLLPLLSSAQLHFVSEYPTVLENNVNTLTDLPLQPTHKKVDVFFNSEKPKLPYYKIRVTTISGSLTSTYNQLLIKLQKQAMDEGFDGLLMLNIVQINDPYYNSVHPLEFSNYLYLNAVGIKYKYNMTYVENIVKSATLELSNPSKTYQINFQMNGQFSDTVYSAGQAYYLQNVSLFNKADQFLTYKYERDADGVIIQPDNAKMVTDSGNIRYIPSLNGTELNLVNIKLPYGLYTVERNYAVSYVSIQPKEKPVTRLLFTGRKNLPYCKDVYNYDDRNRCTGFTRYDSKTNEQILKVKYNFFSMEDLPKAEN
jgi:hypothetical protein